MKFYFNIFHCEQKYIRVYLKYTKNYMSEASYDEKKERRGVKYSSTLFAFKNP